MKSSANYIVCDGCGQRADPEHIATRIQRLETASRYRPIHIGTLFLDLAPPAAFEDDFYGASQPSDFTLQLLGALDIQAPAGEAVADPATLPGRLHEFQHRGYYIAHLSECPVAISPESASTTAETISHLSLNLIKRIQFNYRPKQIALLGKEISLLLQVLNDAGIGSAVLVDDGRPLNVPESSDTSGISRFREVLAGRVPRASSASSM
jgi:hypothetical protein